MNKSLTDLAKQFKELRDKKKAKDEEVKAINAEWGACERELLDAMVEEGVNQVRLDGLGLFSMRTKNYLSVNAGNKPQFFEYLKESGNSDLLKLDVNPKTLTAFLGDHLVKLIEERMPTSDNPTDARTKALEFLNSKGASYFSDKEISLRAE